MTSPHPLAAWLERAQTVQPSRSSGERFPEIDDDLDDLEERRRRRARTVVRVARTRVAAKVSRVRYG